MRTTTLCILVLLALSAGCTDPEQPHMRDPISPRQMPDITYRLNANDRAAISPAFDPDALEEFLQFHAAEQRAGLLETFQSSAFDATASTSRSASAQGVPDVTVLTRVSDPVLQEVLERVWAPAWANLSIEELEDELKRPDTARPGMKIALQRKRDLRRGGQ